MFHKSTYLPPHITDTISSSSLFVLAHVYVALVSLPD